jgi:hypothetical protein
MNNLGRRIERLEETLGMKPGPRDIILTNVDFSMVYGGPLTAEEVDKLREEYAEESDGVSGDA